MLNLFFRGLFFTGTDSQVRLPMMTAFCLPTLVLLKHQLHVRLIRSLHQTQDTRMHTI